MAESVSSDDSSFPTKEYLSTALHSLDSLSEQILQFILTSTTASIKAGGNFDRKLIHQTSLLPQQGDALYASLALMRGLLMDAQAKFKKMVDSNRRLASRIDGTIKSANHEVNILRQELNLTNEKLKEFTLSKLARSEFQDTGEIKKLTEENQKLVSKNRQLELEISNLKQEHRNTENKNKQAFEGLQRDRIRLKSDKDELLNQIRELHVIIEDKENQITEFIREFDLKAKENDKIIKEANQDKCRLSKDHSDLARKHQDLIQVLSTLRSELVQNERRIKELESELFLFQTSIQSHTSKRRSINTTLEENVSSQHKSLISPDNEPNPSTRMQDPLLISSSPVTSRRHVTANGSSEKQSSSSLEDLQSDIPSGGRRPKLVQQFSGSLSRAFKRTRNRKSLEISRFSTIATLPRFHSFSVCLPPPDIDCLLNSSHSSLSEMTTEEKEEILQSNQNVPMQKWKAEIVLIWMDLVLHMSMYVKQCEENIKSGKVLLGLSDSELEKWLGISNPLHRRKLSLAIDEFRNPAVTISNTLPAGQLDHWWVCEQWLRDIGLLQYASRFREHLIDGRTLASLSKKDLEKLFGMEGKKTHQESVISGVELLKMIGFNTQRLDERRMMCQSTDADLLVWNNTRLIQWSKSIDLKEYSSNLRDSGVHGALLVLDFNFTADDLANALGIPANKATVRRHLADEFDVVVKQARESLEDEMACSVDDSWKKNSFSRSAVNNQRTKKGIRLSLSRTLGRQLSRDLSLNEKLTASSFTQTHSTNLPYTKDKRWLFNTVRFRTVM